MKKQYKKPELCFESFELAANIAGCSVPDYEGSTPDGFICSSTDISTSTPEYVPEECYNGANSHS